MRALLQPIPPRLTARRRPPVAPLAAAVVLTFAVLLGPVGTQAQADPAATPSTPANLALVATASTSYVSGHETLTALNDGPDPADSNDKRRGAYGNWPRTGTQWVQYDWPQPIATTRMEVYWFDDHGGVRLPTACRLLYWNGTQFVTVTNAVGLGLAANQFNVTTFPELTTPRLRLEFDGREKFSTGLLEWRVYDSGRSPNFPPVVEAGVDRVVVLPGRTFLRGAVRDDHKPDLKTEVRWNLQVGPGTVTFEDPQASATTARFSAVGTYTLRLTAHDGQLTATDTVQVQVDPAPPPRPLTAVDAPHYEITSPFWAPRLRNVVARWIPHCIDQINDPKLPEGGIENFVQAGRKQAGHTDARHTGAPFANAWVYNTLESMVLALGLKAGDDPELRQAQTRLQATLEDWIPKLLSAQEPDGYLQTQYTITGQRRWSNKHDHEGYNAAYFIEAALAHYRASGFRDDRLYAAARRLAECWVRNIGPAPKRPWYDGHQALEMALIHLARVIEAREGTDPARPYVDLARFLLESRRDGEAYDQSHLPVIQQYEAVGHAVRAVYSYAGMALVAGATGDLDYHSAVRSLADNIVHRKYYVTGGVGSGETSEGFGPDYSLPNRSYCESCAGCGQLFFQHALHLNDAESSHADLFEETLYNAVLGGLDLEARHFTYTNPLDSQEKRYLWHVCPCCVGNLPRTLLLLPTWMYAQGPDRLYVNLYAGSRVTLDSLAGRTVLVEQVTDYPWKGKVTLTVNPAAPTRFALHLRLPDRNRSRLYTPTPADLGPAQVRVNGDSLTPEIARGYAVLEREWKQGDRVELELPLVPQRIEGHPKVTATRGRAALRYGPLIYNLESVDQPLDGSLDPAAPLTAEWQGDLLGGVMVLRGQFTHGPPFLAIPNYARLNRGGRSLVWINAGRPPPNAP